MYTVAIVATVIRARVAIVAIGNFSGKTGTVGAPVIQRTGIAIRAGGVHGRMLAATVNHATVFGTRILVVAVGDRIRDAEAPGAVVSVSAWVVVITGSVVGGVYAPVLSQAGIVGTRIPVVAIGRNAAAA